MVVSLSRCGKVVYARKGEAEAEDEAGRWPPDGQMVEDIMAIVAFPGNCQG